MSPEEVKVQFGLCVRPVLYCGAGWIDVWLFNSGDYRGGIAFTVLPTDANRDRMGVSVS